VLRHLLFFLQCSGRNQARRQLRRLRNPRYVLLAFVGLAYFYFIFGGWLRAPPSAELQLAYLEFGRAVGPLFVGLFAAWWWLWGGHRHGLVLSRAETHLLVPAPLTRRTLVRLKILQAQLPILFSAGLGTLFMRGMPLPWPARLASLWLLLATMHQHQVAASLVHAAAEQHGRQGLRRHLIPILIFATAFAALAWSVTAAAVDIRAAGVGSITGRLTALMAEPGPRVVLAPFSLLLAPLFAESFGDWVRALLPALAVLALHYVWIQRTDAAFEEGAAREGANQEQRAAAFRAGGAGRLRLSRLAGRSGLAPAMVPLDLVRRPAWAIVWKNLLYTQRVFRPAALLIVALGVVLVFSPSLMAGNPARTAFRAAVLLLGAGLVALALGPLAVRNDLRMDLADLRALRTYPLAGRDVVAASIASSTLVVCALSLPLLTGGLLALAATGRLSLPLALAAIAAAIVAAPIVAGLSVTIQNALALLYPGWTRVGHAGSGGIEAIGQNMLVMLGTVVLLTLTMIPALLIAVAVGAPLTLLSPAVSVPVAALAGAATAGAEVVVITRWLGRLFERTDPVSAGIMR
jgi:ABC-2 type transport system permease protein